MQAYLWNLVNLIASSPTFLQANLELESYGYQMCCVEAVGMCGEFYKVRPSDDGLFYVSPSVCKHFISW